MKYFILFYDYVDGMLEKRAPHRPAHLDLLNAFYDRGDVVVSGPLVDPVNGAAIVFRGDSAAVVERFIADDPFIKAGLVTGHRIREWDVAIGKSRLEGPAQ